MLNMKKKSLLPDVSRQSTEAFAEEDSSMKCKTNKTQIKVHVY